MKKKIIISFIFFCTISIFNINPTKIYAEENKYTRTELQNYVVSTALSYYYKNSYADYEQYAMDNENFRSFYRINANNTPEEVSVANTYNIDCSAFAMMVYMNSLGYNLSENNLWKSYSHKIYNQKQDDKISYIYSSSSFENFEQLYQRYGKVFWIDQILYSASYAAQNNLDYYNNLFIYAIGELGDDSAYKKVPLSKDITIGLPTDNDYLEKKETVVNDLKTKLQPGDILLYSSKKFNDESNKFENTGGHAMLYVGNAISKKDGEVGLIHSTGNDIEYEVDKNTKNETGELIYSGYDSNGIKYDDFNTYIDDLYNYDGVNDLRIPRFFVIMRPINYYLDGVSSISDTELKEKVGYTKYKENYSKYINNTISRNKLKNLSVEQYISQVDNKKFYPYSTTEKPLSIYSTVGQNDNLTYNLKLTNKSIIEYCTKNKYTSKSTCEEAGYTWNVNSNSLETINNLAIKVKIPDNTEFISCKGANGTCDKVTIDGITYVQFNDIVIDSTNSMNYTFVVKIKENIYVDSITFNGGILKYTDNYIYNIRMSDISIKVAEYNKTSDITTSLENKINNNVCDSATNMNDYIKCIYSNINNINFEIVNDYLNKSSYFTSVKAMKTGTKSSPEYLDAYIKSDYSKENIVVNGLYGGRKLVGNFLGDRGQMLKSYYLEYGDIILSDYNNKTSIYLYVGHNKQYEPKFITFKDNKIVKIGFSDTKDENKIYLEGYNLLKSFYAKDLYVVLRPSKIYISKTTQNQNNLGINNPPTGQTSIIAIIILIAISAISTIYFKNKTKQINY